ncbi:YwiC-like family protein [Cellulosimicrobium marinum]|uniref:YwiC-like family protein n=1 Tax=Cellulosimicrobium marinum TaxID=1638992 RepID=UPI001E50D4A6|nr:YwiC-like family protein [Cellulosimicrobium marinum]MCB7135030.1 YwiC-like family protein [Cellulosimicrobium marinum]
MSRRPPGWVPNQHGAWPMLLLPFVVGTARGIQDAGFRPTTVALGALWLVGYLAYFAAGLWLKSRRRPRYRRPMLTYGAVTVALGAVVLVLDPALALWAPAFLPFLAVGLWASAQRTERSVAAGGALTVAASLMTVVAYVACRPAGAAVLDVPGVLWLVAALLLAYLFGTVLYVKTMIRERGVRSYVVGSVAFHAGVTVAAAALAVVHDPSWWWATAFLAAATARAAVLPGRALSPRVVGAGEIVATVLLLGVALVVR